MAGTGASRPATAIALAKDLFRWRAARLPATLSATPARVRCPGAGGRKSAGFFGAAGLLSSCTLYGAIVPRNVQASKLLENSPTLKIENGN